MDSLDELFLRSLAPVAPSDLGRGARLLVPNGLAFGALQLRRGRTWFDWFREEPDRHNLPGSRHSLHLGVDLAYFIRRGVVWMLPRELPVRAIASGVVAASFAGGTPELEPGGMIILHGPGPAATARCVVPFTYLGDVRELKRPGEVVKAGEVVAVTLGQVPQKRPRVVVHLGVGLSIPGHGLEFLDPTSLLRRWGVRHPVEPTSTCDPRRLAGAAPGTWRAPGKIEGGSPGPSWSPSWRSRY